MKSGFYSPELWARICADTLAHEEAARAYVLGEYAPEAEKIFFSTLKKLYEPCKAEPLKSYIQVLATDPERVRAEALENIRQINAGDYKQFLSSYGLEDNNANFAIFTNCVNYALARVYSWPVEFGIENSRAIVELPEDLQIEREHKYTELHTGEAGEPKKAEKLPPLPKPRKTIISHTPFDFVLTNPEKIAEVTAGTLEAEKNNKTNRKVLENWRIRKKDPDFMHPDYKEFYGASFQALKADKKNDLPAVYTNYSLLLPENIPELNRLSGFQLAVLSVGIFSLLNDLELEEKDRARKEKRAPRPLQDIPRKELPLKFRAKDLYERFTGIPRKWSVDGSTFPEMMRALDVLAGIRLFIDCTEEMKRRGKYFAPGERELSRNYLLPLKMTIPYRLYGSYDLDEVIELFEVPDLYIYMKNCGYYEAISPGAFRIGGKNTPDQIAINFYIRQQLAMMKKGIRISNGTILLDKVLQITETKAPEDKKQLKHWREDRKKDIEKVLCALIKAGELQTFTPEELTQEQEATNNRLTLGRGGCCIWTFKNRICHSFKLKIPEIEARKANARIQKQGPTEYS